ncbi:MAG: ADP-forming succinate--CoA ligase subunit beta [Deltaproteobacteria bacterium]|nr:ADP-forming succinate--CoA ligase subunit beta [Deltaproteobacteria bacterium]
MNIHEYQAKEVLKKYGVPVLKNGVARTPQEAEKVAKSLGGGVCVVKAQVHAGGRGKAGGVQLVKSPAEVKQVAGTLLGKNLVTIQSGPEGKPVSTLLVEEGCNIHKEFYVSLLLDRGRGQLAFMVSSEGGVEIEKLAVEQPEKILTVYINTQFGFLNYQKAELARFLTQQKELQAKLISLFAKLYEAFIHNDCSLLELNPLVQTKDSLFIALDAKMGFDDNALFRHKDLAELRDLEQENKMEVEARKYGLSYIALDGNIACMVNGAGLAMATMDIIKLHGGAPANFLDVGGSATTEAVTEAFKIILSDSKVNAILVNIFGGIMKCDVVASGIIGALQNVSLSVPLVVRLEGTNVELGKKMLNEAPFAIMTATGMEEAAKKVTDAVKQTSARGRTQEISAGKV